MDEQAAERVVVLFVDAGLSVEDGLVLLDIVFVLVSAHLVSSVDDGLLFFSTGFSTGRSDVVKVAFVVGLVRLAAESVGTRLDAEHEGYTDTNHDQEDDGKGLLSTEPVYWLNAFRYKGRLISEFHQVVNHNRNDSGVIVESVEPVLGGVVGIEGVDPLLDDQEVHVAEETVQDDQTANDFEEQDDYLSFVDSVKTLDDDSHAHVSDSDDDRGSHLDGVEEGQGVGVQVPGGISSEGVDAVSSFVVATVLVPRTPDGISFRDRGCTDIFPDPNFRVTVESQVIRVVCLVVSAECVGW